MINLNKLLIATIIALGLLSLTVKASQAISSCHWECSRYWRSICMDWDYVCPKPTPAPQCKQENAECNINESGKECCDGLSCQLFNERSGNHKCLPVVTPTVEPTPTPTVVEEEVTPTPTPEYRKADYWDCTMDNSCPGVVTTPVCRDGQVLQLPANFHVIRRGEVAILKWNPTGGSQVNVFYRENENDNWTHALGDQTNNGYIEIKNLKPEIGYTFGLQQKNGCAGGELVTAVVIDPPSRWWKIFTLSYWHW